MRRNVKGPVATAVVALGCGALDLTVDVLGDEIAERVGHGEGVRAGVVVDVRARGDGAGFARRRDRVSTLGRAVTSGAARKYYTRARDAAAPAAEIEAVRDK